MISGTPIAQKSTPISRNGSKKYEMGVLFEAFSGVVLREPLSGRLPGDGLESTEESGLAGKTGLFNNR